MHSDRSDRSDKSPVEPNRDDRQHRRNIPPRPPLTADDVAAKLREANARQVVRIDLLGKHLQVARQREAQLRHLLDEAGVDLISYDRGHEAGYRAGQQTARRQTTGVGIDLLSELIRLTHPDRHPAERHDEANRVTARLIGMRDDLRAR